MATHPSRRGWSYEEFARLRDQDERHRYELIDAELVVTPSPVPNHQELVVRLLLAIRMFVDQHALGRVLVGPIDVLFDPGNYLAPDLIFVRADRTKVITERGVEAAPDLVVEIVSPSTAARDRGVKRQRYAAFGVGEYWIVDERRSEVAVYRFRENADIPMVFTTGTLDWTPMPGGPTLALDVAALFSGLER
jgi:Uma2 family endonuclease